MTPSPDSSSAGWRVLGASVRGTAHERTGAPCQDAHGWVVTPAGTFAAAVSDGAGSSPRSDEGARWAVEAALRTLREADSFGAGAEVREAALRAALAAARDAVVSGAAAAGAEPRDFSATLIVLLADSTGVSAAQIGDGLAAAEMEGAGLVGITTPTRGEYANETVFVDTPGALEGAQVRTVSGAVRGVAVISDGLQILATELSTGKPHAPFFAPFLRFAGDGGDAAEAKAQLEAFLAGPRVSERTDDDKTLLVAVRG